MIAACAILLAQLAASPTPTAPPMGRSTPVPAGSSLQEFAKRKRGIAPDDLTKSGSVSVTAEGSAGLFRHEGLVGRSVPEGVRIEGKAFDGRQRQRIDDEAVLEVFATRRDGRVQRGLVPLTWEDRSPKSTDARDRVFGASFSRVLYAPSGLENPASLRPETAGGRFHFRPTRDFGAAVYFEQAKCLSYWAKPLRSPGAKEDDLVEVHVLNACAWAVRPVYSWFVIRVQEDSSIEAWDRKIYGLFFEDVPARGELDQVVPVKVPKGRYVKAVAWRLD